jgi:hypothetical protein
MSGIFWLASYPKSGNTWFRVFLTNLLRNSDTPANINELDKSPIASGRAIFDEAMGFEASDLTADEIDQLRPELYIHLAETAEEPLFMKVHDAYTDMAEHTPIIPREATAGAFYFLRNPVERRGFLCPITTGAMTSRGSSSLWRSRGARDTSIALKRRSATVANGGCGWK